MRLTVNLQHTTSGEPVIIEGTNTLAQAHELFRDLELSLEDWSGEIRLVGDAASPCTAEEAPLEGLKAGCEI